MNAINIGDLLYDGMFTRYHGLRYEITVIKEGQAIKKVFVAPSLDQLKILSMPEEIKPEISNFIREWLDYRREPVYINPRLN